MAAAAGVFAASALVQQSATGAWAPEEGRAALGRAERPEPMVEEPAPGPQESRQGLPAVWVLVRHDDDDDENEGAA